jgi:hypothetical protein
VHKFWRPFEDKRVQIATKCSQRRYGKYAGKPVPEILHLWDVARDTGSAKHACADDFLQGRPARTHQRGVGNAHGEPTAGLYKFLAAHPTWVPYRTEWSLFSKEHLLAGQTDAVFYDLATGEHTLCDWKFTQSISKEAFPPDRGEEPDLFGTHPLTATVPNSNYYQYSLQLNIYRELLTRHYGIAVRSMTIVNFCPDRPDDFEEFPVPYWDMAPFFALLPWTAKTDQSHAH